MDRDEELKEAFNRVKNDIGYLNQEIQTLKSGLEELKFFITNLSKELNTLRGALNVFSLNQNTSQTTPTHNPESQTSSTHPSTHQHTFKPLKGQNSAISIGNERVPTDRQTHQQTDRHTPNRVKTQEIIEEALPDPIKDAAKILSSLDSLRKEIRLKFKRLTDKEVEVFSTLYQLDEENNGTNYKSIARRLHLTESSIRDYIGRLITKGIPVDKKKINNKTIVLSVSTDLKKVASLTTILQLRNL